MPSVIFHVSGRKIFASYFAKFAAPVIQPDLESFASKRLLDDDVVAPSLFTSKATIASEISFDSKVRSPFPRPVK